MVDSKPLHKRDSEDYARSRIHDSALGSGLVGTRKRLERVRHCDYGSKEFDVSIQPSSWVYKVVGHVYNEEIFVPGAGQRLFGYCSKCLNLYKTKKLD